MSDQEGFFGVFVKVQTVAADPLEGTVNAPVVPVPELVTPPVQAHVEVYLSPMFPDTSDSENVSWFPHDTGSGPTISVCTPTVSPCSLHQMSQR